MPGVEEVKEEIRKLVRERHKDKPEIFHKIADEIIRVFGYVYPGDTEKLIEKISQHFPESTESTDAELVMMCICEKCKDKGVVCELKYRSKIDLEPGEAIFRLPPNRCPNSNTRADWKVIEVRLER